MNPHTPPATPEPPSAVTVPLVLQYSTMPSAALIRPPAPALVATTSPAKVQFEVVEVNPITIPASDPVEFCPVIAPVMFTPSINVVLQTANMRQNECAVSITNQLKNLIRF
jgi:hypothetical protein